MSIQHAPKRSVKPCAVPRSYLGVSVLLPAPSRRVERTGLRPVRQAIFFILRSPRHQYRTVLSLMCGAQAFCVSVNQPTHVRIAMLIAVTLSLCANCLCHQQPGSQAAPSPPPPLQPHDNLHARRVRLTVMVSLTHRLPSPAVACTALTPSPLTCHSLCNTHALPPSLPYTTLSSWASSPAKSALWVPLSLGFP